MSSTEINNQTSFIKQALNSILCTAVVACVLVVFNIRKHRKSKTPLKLKPIQKNVTLPVHTGDIAKQRFHISKADSQIPRDIDYIVIGSGIGGLSCAACLARVGRRVLVLEQHDRLGGCMHQFSKTYQWDTGIHYIGRGEKYQQWLHTITNNTSIKLDLLGAKDELVYDQYIYQTDAGATTFKARAKSRMRDMYRQYPQHTCELRQLEKLLAQSDTLITLLVFCRLIKSTFCARMLHYAVSWWYRHLWNKSILDVLDSVVTSKLLKLDFLGNAGDMGGELGKLPAFIGFTLFAHYLNGGYYIRGGPQEVTRALIPVVERAGGRCLANAKVSRVLFDSNRVVGVVVNYGRPDQRNLRTDASKEYKINCKYGVISAAGFHNTFKELVPLALAPAPAPDVLSSDSDYRMKIERALNVLQPSVQHFHVFIGFNKSKEELQLPSHNRWTYQTGCRDIGGLEEYDYDAQLREFHRDPLNANLICFMSFPCAKDREYNASVSNCVLLAEIPGYHFSEWEFNKHDRRGDEYMSLKDKIAKRMMEEVLFKQFPQTRGCIAKIECGTALSSKFYLGSNVGESYGLHPSNERYFDFDVSRLLKPKQPVKGFYLAGQDVLTPGWSSAFHSGVMCAESVLGYHDFGVLVSGRTLMRDLRKMNKLLANTQNS